MSEHLAQLQRAARDPRVIRAAFPGLDFALHGVEVAVASALVSIDTALALSGGRPELRRAIEADLTAVRAELLAVLGTARATPPDPPPAPLALPPAVGQ